MPPVRWKPLPALVVCVFHLVFYTDAQIRQDTVSMTADGWKPIVGTRRPGYYEFKSDSSDIYKYEVFSTPPPTNTALPPTASAGPEQKPFRGSPKPANKPTFEGNKFPGRKIPHQKHPQHNPYFTLPNYDSHGPHIPLGAVIHTRPSQIGHIKPLATSIKPFIQISPSSKRNIKPIRIQTSTNNYRDDIFTASATSGFPGTYTHFKTPTSNIRTRETIDLGLPGANHYSINQPHAHIEFANRFALPPTSESVFQQYNNPAIPAFIFSKHPQSNDVNYQFNTQEDFTRNLVPPPQIYRNKEAGTEKVKEKGKVQENVVLQVPPPFQFQKGNDPVQVQVTREKIQEFHNNVPPGFDGQYVEYDFSGVRQPTVPSKPVYEVTEGKWEEPPSQRPIRTRKPSQPKRRPEITPEVPVFLPTPYKPDGQSGIIPTSPTQSEVSTIFTKLSKLQREKAYTTPSPNDYNVKEVSTHYPVFGKPVFANPPPSDEISNDITTPHEEVVTTTKEPQRVRPHRRRRPESRRTTTTTTTEQPEVIENYDSQRTQENEAYSQSVETERPVRIRRPSRYRTTTPPSETSDVTTKPSRGRNRYRTRNGENTSYESIRKRIRPLRVETTPPVSEETYDRSSESEAVASEKSEEIEDNPKAETVELELPGRHYITEPPKKVRYETIRPFIVITTTEKAPTTNLVVPENEVDSTSLASVEETTTPAPTTTTTTTTTQSPNRIRGRPLKFDNSNRPRFSVKDYRQKLSQYSTTTTTPEPHRSTDNPRIRLPSRLRRPTTSTTANNEEESTEPVRSRFVPKDPRHSGTTEDTNAAIITEKNVKSVNTRLRPFGRYKSTTAATTSTPKVSIKPNLFNRKRPPMISLKSRIYGKYKNNTETTTEKVTTTEENEVEESTFEYDDAESTTERSKVTEDSLEVDTTTVGDISKIDANLYSARVSDLTSSAKNDYNTFKSVAPTSRRIPNYFTIATDDPILPIEAFFPNIKDKIREKDS
ncbi:proteoglycan 4 isoform X1 [Tribolium castaneum]|uniref:proteoglycan 4 isoform X1 n=1 Tax=Tribolium castaneum TaxID=7070 RepID=UPI0030FE0BDA